MEEKVSSFDRGVFAFIMCDGNGWGRGKKPGQEAMSGRDSKRPQDAVRAARVRRCTSGEWPWVAGPCGSECS